MKKLECNKCEYKWYPRTPKRPELCPACKCRKWDKEKNVKRQHKGEQE